MFVANQNSVIHRLDDEVEHHRQSSIAATAD